MKKIKLKPFNYKKELKKVQGKGIHSKRFKYITMFSIIGVAILSIFIYRSMAMYSFSSGRYSAFKTTTSKKIKVNAKANNGYVEGSLADKIISQAKNNGKFKEGTNPDFSKGEPPTSGSTVAGSGLFKTNDDDGESYYFRGEIEDNYVKFGQGTTENNSTKHDLIWRIVRINGDGTIRLVLNERLASNSFSTSGNAGYTYNVGNTPCTKNNPCQSTFDGVNFSNNRGENSSIKTFIETWYKNNLSQLDDYIEYSVYCDDTSVNNATTRFTAQTPSLLCPNTTNNYGGFYKLKIGLLSADEIWLAGYAKYPAASNSKNYLYRDYYWWSMSQNTSGPYVYNVKSGVIYGDAIEKSNYILPVINLRADAIVESGNGTSESNAYKIRTEEKTTDYKTTTTMKVYPNYGYEYDTSKGVTCTNGQSGSYNKTNNTLAITSPSKDTECTVNFKQLPKLSDKIIADAKSKNIYKTSTPDYSKGEPPSDGTTTSTGSGLFSAPDENNTTSYYFRGNVNSNYVKFGQGKTADNSNKHELTWRIIRINGDGTIRLILNESIDYAAFNTSNNLRKYVGYTYNNVIPCTTSNPCQSTYNNSPTFTNTPEGTSSNIKMELEKWYYNNLKAFDEKIAYGTYCNDTSFGSGSEAGTLYYGTYQRLVNGNSSQPTLICPSPIVGTMGSTSEDDTTTVNGIRYHTYGGVYKLKVGLLSADEINYVGLPYSDITATAGNYWYISSYWWSMSPSYSRETANALVGVFGRLENKNNIVDMDTLFVFPVINLDASVLTSGSGTSSDPYLIY